MVRSTLRLGATSLLWTLLVGAAGSESVAGTLVTVTFGGTGFSGHFTYDQSQPVSGTAGLFDFTNSSLFHQVCYTIGTSSQVCAQQTQCTAFKIQTSINGGKTFQLNANTKIPTQVQVVLPTNAPLSQTSLPLCSTFPNPPLAGSQFTVTGAVTFSGAITTIQCTQTAALSAPSKGVSVARPSHGADPDQRDVGSSGRAIAGARSRLRIGRSTGSSRIVSR